MSKYIILDNNGDTFDRYTVLLQSDFDSSTGDNTMIDCLGLSDNFDMPNGFSQWSTCSVGWVEDCTDTRLSFFKLPESMQRHINDRFGD